MPTWLKILLAAYVLWRVVKHFRPAKRAAFTPRKHWALALAQPMLETTGLTGFMSPVTTELNEETRKLFRAPLLHQMELRPTTSDDEVRAHLSRVLEAQWFRADLHALQPTDDPRAALAFACVRMAFLARNAMLMGWVDPMVAWRVLLLNAQRAQDCFASWEDFGHAFIAGRRQWVAAFRADPLGSGFDASHVRQLLGLDGAWAGLPWPGEPALSPSAAQTAA
ncbi:DUF1266 domain-containing protein [Ralstonia sp. 24A2]|uniref:DUF1266 domain-containing protein n=1 Tax=Ralstonia sp. 24A2 TaxID=3447364 RepID=UPI003F6A1FF1